MDEPTAVLTPQEANTLFATLRSMAAEGKTVIFISHKLHEVMAVADRVTVLRGGRTVTTVDVADATLRSLAASMVGRDVDAARRQVPEHTPGAVALELAGGERGRRPRRRGAARRVAACARRRDRGHRRGRRQRPARARRDDRGHARAERGLRAGRRPDASRGRSPRARSPRASPTCPRTGWARGLLRASASRATRS